MINASKYDPSQWLRKRTELRTGCSKRTKQEGCVLRKSRHLHRCIGKFWMVSRTIKVKQIGTIGKMSVVKRSLQPVVCIKHNSLFGTQEYFSNNYTSCLALLQYKTDLMTYSSIFSHQQCRVLNRTTNTSVLRVLVMGPNHWFMNPKWLMVSL